MPDEDFFDVELLNIENHILDNLSDLIVGVGSEILTTLTSKPPIGTPIDTGWASANWLYGSDITSTNPVASKQTVPRALSTQYNSLGLLINRNKRDYSSYYIYNNVPYIYKLNTGTSKQAPRMFVQKAIQRGVKSAKKYFNKENR